MAHESHVADQRTSCAGQTLERGDLELFNQAFKYVLVVLSGLLRFDADVSYGF